MKIALVGSRDIKDQALIEKIIYNHFEIKLKSDGTRIVEDSLVTGDADGVDSIAIDICRKLGIKYESFSPISPTPKINYHLRNAEIIGRSDLIIAVWDGSSPGTKFVIDYAKKRKKRLIVYEPENNFEGKIFI